jgi:hypothetical protein
MMQRNMRTGETRFGSLLFDDIGRAPACTNKALSSDGGQ